MTGKRPRITRQPRVAQTDETMGAYLDHSASWLRLHMPRLIAAGFPKRDALLDGWDLNAVDAWLDRRSGMIPTERIDLKKAQTSELEEAFGVGQIRHSLSA